MKNNIRFTIVLVFLILILTALVLGDVVLFVSPDRFARITTILGIDGFREKDAGVINAEAPDTDSVTEAEAPESGTDVPESEAPESGTDAPETDVPETGTEVPETDYVTETDAETDSQGPQNPSYGGQVGWSQPKELSWFDDALFIGDSRTMGFCNFMGINGCAAQVALGASNALTSVCMPVMADGGLKYCTLLDSLAGKWNGYSKVYVWFGVNDHATPASSFKASYSGFIAALRERVKDGTEIYVVSILPVNDAKAAENRYKVTNAELVRLNDAIADMCVEDGIAFVNAAESLTDDENGFTLSYDESNDGIHLNGSTCRTVRSYLLSHTIG